MSRAASIEIMQQAIINYIQRNIPQDKNFAHLGRVEGRRVIIGSRSYPYISTVDDFFSDGDFVYCILPKAQNIAAIVGVAT